MCNNSFRKESRPNPLSSFHTVNGRIKLGPIYVSRNPKQFVGSEDPPGSSKVVSTGLEGQRQRVRRRRV